MDNDIKFKIFNFYLKEKYYYKFIKLSNELKLAFKYNRTKQNLVFNFSSHSNLELGIRIGLQVLSKAFSRLLSVFSIPN